MGRDEGQSSGEVPGYDQRRSRARVTLLEQQVILAEAIQDLEEAAARPDRRPVLMTWGAGAGSGRAGRRRGTPLDRRARPGRRRPRVRVRRAWPVPPRPPGPVPGRVHRHHRHRNQQPGQHAASAARQPAGHREQAGTRRDPRADKPGNRPAGLPPGTPGVHRRCHVLRMPTAAVWHATGVTFCLQSGAVLREPCPCWPVWNAKISAGLARFAEAMRPHQTTSRSRPAAARGHRRRIPGRGPHRPADPDPARPSRSPGPAWQEGLLGNLARRTRPDDQRTLGKIRASGRPGS